MTPEHEDITQETEPKTDREDGGPVAEENAPEPDDHGVHGTKESPFEAHE